MHPCPPFVFLLLSLASAGVWAQGAPCPVSAPGQGAAAQIVALTGQGQARAQEAQPWAAAHLEQRLAPGADLRTLALSSAALLLADRTQIRLAAQSLVRLCDARLDVGAGRLWARTKGQAVQLQLHTPAAVAAVRGTDWDVQVDASGHTLLTVLSGRMEVFNAQGRVELGPSEQASVAPGQAPLKRLLVQARERVQWVMAPALVPNRWPQLAQAGGPWRVQALAALRSGQLLQLQEVLDTRLADDAADPLAQRLRAEIDLAQGDWEAAQQRLHATWEQTQDAWAAARYVQLLQAQEHTEAARRFLQQAQARAPQAVALLLAEADMLRLTGQGRAALARYREAAAQAQEDSVQAGVQADWGRALLEMGDLHAARRRLARAVALAADDPDYRARAATADAQALQLEAAQQGFAHALQEAGDDYVALAGDGLLQLQRGQFERAREQLLKALVIEPRYASAQVWLAVAEYRLDHPGAAFDALARARQADPNDPLPWQIEALLRHDQGETEVAIAAAREALTRLPYLHSLNPLMSDSQGSANLGKALADFGLEHWARAYAQQSYYPLWAGSHLFLAHRYESDFARNSELLQGYLSDPLALGVNERYPSVLPVQEGQWTLNTVAGRDRVRNTGASSLGHTGLHADVLPLAWNIRAEMQDMQPRSGSGSYWMQAPGWVLAVGARPLDRLGLLLLLQESWARYAYPGGLQLSPFAWLDDTARQHAQRADFGGSWRWSAQEQTWFKLHSASAWQQLEVSLRDQGALDSLVREQDQGLMLRHTLEQGARRFSLGWERQRLDSPSFLGDRAETSLYRSRVRLDMPWAAYEDALGPWAWQVQASAPRLRAEGLARDYDTASGHDLLPPVRQSGRDARSLLTRLGLSYRWGPGRALHVAYLESVRGLGAHTLAPVAVGAVPVDYQYHLPGAYARKVALQWDWELGPRSFFYASVQRQDIANPTFADGSFLVPRQALSQYDRLSNLGAITPTAQTLVDPYSGTPAFGQGRLDIASLAYNRVLTPHWAGFVGYTAVHSRNTGLRYSGQRLPGFARHTLVLAGNYQHGVRRLTGGSLVWRSNFFEDEAQTLRQGAHWKLILQHSVETSDRRWNFVGWVSAPLDGRSTPELWLRARYRF